MTIEVSYTHFVHKECVS